MNMGGAKMGFYRFLHSRWIDSTMSGLLRVGNARYYRLLELATDDDWIGDRGESMAVAHINSLQVNDDNRDPAVLRMMELNRIGTVAPGASMSMKGVTISSRHDCYIQSMSQGEYSDLEPIMTDPSNPRFAYDGCIEFIDPHALCTHLMRYGTIGSRPLADVFYRIDCGPVQYIGQATDAFAAPIQGNPYLKHPKYASQSEFRIVFHCRPGVSGDHQFVRFPDADFFLRVARREPIAPAVSAVPVSLGEHVQALADIHARIKAHRDGTAKLFSLNRAGNMGGTEESCQAREADFEKEFRQSHFQRLLQSYWVVRESHPCDEVDQALDPFCTIHALFPALSCYLYGTGYRANEYEWTLRPPDTKPRQGLCYEILGENVTRTILL